MVKDGVPVEMQAVGAGAVNQAIKAIAISRGFLSPVGIEIACIPSFADIIIDGEYRTAIHFSIRVEIGPDSMLSLKSDQFHLLKGHGLCG